MAGMEVMRFDVKYGDGASGLPTTMTIHDDYIECPMTPNIKFSTLSQIMINHMDTTQYRGSSFGLKSEGIIFNFCAKSNRNRNEILSEILNRFPSNVTDRAHRESIQSEIGEVALVIDHKEECQELENGAWGQNEGDMPMKSDGKRDASDAVLENSNVLSPATISKQVEQETDLEKAESLNRKLLREKAERDELVRMVCEDTRMLRIKAQEIEKKLQQTFQVNQAELAHIKGVPSLKMKENVKSARIFKVDLKYQIPVR